jgi:hypothetical protein
VQGEIMGESKNGDATIRRIIALEVVNNYTLRLGFDDGVERVIDFEPILSGPLFGQLQDITLFNQVQLEPSFGTVEWPNGADIDPMLLYHWPRNVDKIIERRKRDPAISS